jgi:hypothetical protein
VKRFFSAALVLLAVAIVPAGPTEGNPIFGTYDNVPAPFAGCSALGTACAGAIIVVFSGCKDVAASAKIPILPDADINAELCVSFAGGMGPTAGSAVAWGRQQAYVTVSWETPVVPAPVASSALLCVCTMPRGVVDSEIAAVSSLTGSPTPICSRPAEEEADGGDIPEYEEQYCVLNYGLLSHYVMATHAATTEPFSCTTVTIENYVSNGFEKFSAPQTYDGCDFLNLRLLEEPANAATDRTVAHTTAGSLPAEGREAVASMLSDANLQYQRKLDDLVYPGAPAGLVQVVNEMKDWVRHSLSPRDDLVVQVRSIE